jgi:hypothetical protein
LEHILRYYWWRVRPRTGGGQFVIRGVLVKGYMLIGGYRSKRRFVLKEGCVGGPRTLWSDWTGHETTIGGEDRLKK